MRSSGAQNLADEIGFFHQASAFPAPCSLLLALCSHFGCLRARVLECFLISLYSNRPTYRLFSSLGLRTSRLPGRFPDVPGDGRVSAAATAAPQGKAGFLAVKQRLSGEQRSRGENSRGKLVAHSRDGIADKVAHDADDGGGGGGIGPA